MIKRCVSISAEARRRNAVLGDCKDAEQHSGVFHLIVTVVVLITLQNDPSTLILSQPVLVSIVLAHLAQLIL